MDATNDILEIRFAGNDVKPNTVKPHEVAELIVALKNRYYQTLKNGILKISLKHNSK